MTENPSPVPEPGPGVPSPGVSRAIYGMPMFVTLAVADLEATRSWYVAGLGFVELFVLPGPDGRPLLVHLRRWRFQDLLIRPADRPVTPGNGCRISLAAVYDELDALAASACAHGGGSVSGPSDTGWNTRDLTTADPDGNVVVFTAARPAELSDPAFSELIRGGRVRARGGPGRSAATSPSTMPPARPRPSCSASSR